MNETVAGAEVDVDQVVEYLKANRDFLSRRPELLERLDLTHTTGSAVSLIERQVEILRGRNRQLESRLGQLVETAKENEDRVKNVHELARALIRAPTLASSILGLQQCMRESFSISNVFVGVSAPILKHTNIDGLVRLDPDGSIAKTFDDFFRTKLIECGPLEENKAKLLFPKLAELPKSAAIVPLEREKNLGMLVLASADPERFKPRQGKFFLEMTSDLLSAALRAKLGQQN